MGVKEVFASLQEIFPQVDLRILKAVAIEHPSDVGAAVESIIVDVLPTITGSHEPSHPMQDKNGTEYSSIPDDKGKQPILFGHQEVEEASTNHLPVQEPVACEATFSNVGKGKQPMLFGPPEVEKGTSSHLLGQEPVANENSVSNCFNSANVTSPYIVEAYPKDLEVGLYSKELESSTSRDSALRELNTNPELQPSFVEKIIDLNTDVEDILLQSSKGRDKSTDASDRVNVFVESSNSPHECPLEHPMVQPSENTIDSLHESLQKSDYPVQPPIAINLPGLEANSTVSAALPPAGDVEVCDKAVYSSGCAIDKLTTTANDSETPYPKLADEHAADFLSYESEMLSANDDSLPTTLLTRSGHSVNVEYLEDLISNAESNKNKILSAMELTTNMMREVELLEERSKQAKEAASSAGQDILSKVEELKDILKHAKEANDMHAGEIYGERAILATEAGELQSRFLSLLDEENKSLSVIGEIQKTLEARAAVLEEEIAKAELEKLEKAAVATEALREQEVIMASVVEESKKLQQEADINSKLRDFLMHCGRLVDARQGEYAVTSEDLMLRKSIVDGHVPLDRSLHLTTSLSSSSSYYRTKHSSDGVMENEDVSEKPVITENEKHEIQHSEKSSILDDAATDDGWEILKDSL
ncbi:hypothetical protein Cni_G11927 [Canna indica]|uniref:CUE domain-containing protein n=1 Tax=Canna indica TaxID=4628 RepID=A0AAQ3K748_9LILI|nr:hypothetical protein Cni_G11927 [Canna indica]